MKHYFTLIVLLALVSGLSYVAGASHQKVKSAARQRQMVSEFQYGVSINSASEKFRVLQDLRTDNDDCAVSRLSKLIDLDLLQASISRPTDFQHLDMLTKTDWPALRETRNTL